MEQILEVEDCRVEDCRVETSLRDEPDIQEMLVIITDYFKSVLNI